MATARFQVVSLPRPAAEPAERALVNGALRARRDPSPPPARRFVWRFLAANNRSLAQATTVYPDARSCFEAMNDMKQNLAEAVCELTRDEDGLWMWTVRLSTDVVASTHRYPRQVRARLTCDTFLALAATPDVFENVQVVYR